MLELYHPGKNFITVSVTGSHCDLMCGHCNARFLKHMEPATSPDALYELALGAEKSGCLGMLISGGCDDTGKVPFFKYLDIINKIKENTFLTLNLHTGLIDEGDVRKIMHPDIDIISYDVVGSNQVVKKMYGLSLPDNYFDRMLGTFHDAGLNVAPHITAGLDNGLESGEERALNIIAKHPPKMVVINSLIPRPGQILMEHRLIPVLELAGKILPDDVKIGIGCMRPRNIDLSIDMLTGCRVSSIAMPPNDIRDRLSENGIKYVEKSGCCALV